MRQKRKKCFIDKRKIANKMVKEKLLTALISFSGEKDWSKVTVTELIKKSGVARASFYRNFKSIEEIIDYGIEQMTSCYNKGKLYLAEDFHSKEFMMIYWLENGIKETPEAMADEFLYIVNGSK